MQLDVEKLLKSDPQTLRAWHVYRDGDESEPPFEVELRCATADEQQSFMRKSGKKKSPSAREWSEFFLAHVLNWRGLRHGTTEVPFENETLRLLWARDSLFHAWVVETCQELDNFR